MWVGAVAIWHSQDCGELQRARRAHSLGVKCSHTSSPGYHLRGMDTLKSAVGIAWVAFSVFWLVSALDTKAVKPRRRRAPFAGFTAVSVVVLFAFGNGSLTIHSTAVAAVGTLVFASGIALAVWARLHLGRNWGMPMTEKEDPELVTSGPYRLIRHPIYSGLLVALIGTTLVTSPLGLMVVVLMGGYFGYCASVEERSLRAAFPAEYPAYSANTKMLVPFVL